MLHSDKFEQTTFDWKDKTYKMEYDLSLIEDHSVTAFGNIYTPSEEEPLSFTFITENHEITAFTPMNGTKEFMQEVVKTITGIMYPFSKSLNFEDYKPGEKL